MKSLALVVLLGVMYSGSSFAASCPMAKDVIAPYLKVVEALAADKLDAKAGAELGKAVKSIAMKPGCAEMVGDLGVAGEAIATAKDIAAAREALKKTDGAVKRLFVAVKPEGIDIDYCPMVKAHWLQRKGPLRNPYYGSSMLECGYNNNKRVLDGGAK